MLDDQHSTRVIPRQFRNKHEMDAIHAAERQIFEVTNGAVGYQYVTKAKMREIASSVAMDRGMTLEDLLSNSKVRRIAHARFIAWKEIYDRRDKNGNRVFSLNQIGSYFGKDHTTVMHGIRRADEIIEQEDELKCSN